MKNLLGFATALGFVSSVAPTAIACNTQQENSNKIILGKLINRVETIIQTASQQGTPELKTLKLTLMRAKEVHRRTSSTDADYIDATQRLEQDLNDYQHPGYKEAIKRLQAWIEDAKKTIIENKGIKSDTVLQDLETAIKEAETVVSKEVELINIKSAEQRLRYYLERYKEWDWEDHKND